MGVPHEPLPQQNWVDSLQTYLHPYWNDVIAGEWAQKLQARVWTPDAMRGCILQLYPFIHSFPKFLASLLIKSQDDYTRNFLIDNIRVEKAHADHWLWMGEGFGVKAEDMLSLANGKGTVLRDVQSLTDWLWYINTHGTLGEAMAATCFAIEGATGDMSRALQPAFEAYADVPGIDMSPRTTRWLRNHAKYDDEHPKIALEIVARSAQTEAERIRVMHAAKRSLELLHLALLRGAQAYQRAPLTSFEGTNRRGTERRLRTDPIGFPERRQNDRRAERLAS